MAKTRVDPAGGSMLKRVSTLKSAPTPPKKNPQRGVGLRAGTKMAGGFKKDVILDASQIQDRRGQTFVYRSEKNPWQMGRPTPGPAPRPGPSTSPDYFTRKKR